MNHWLIHKQIKYEWNDRRRLTESKVYSQLRRIASHVSTQWWNRLQQPKTFKVNGFLYRTMGCAPK